jgi:hypothetical protein
METRYIPYSVGVKHNKRIKKDLEERQRDLPGRYKTRHLSENTNKMDEADEIFLQIYRNMYTASTEIDRCYYQQLKPGT